MGTELRGFVATGARIARGLTLLLGAATCSISVAASYSEDAVKAAYLHRFASYVYWPSGSQPEAPVVIGVFGANSVAAELRSLAPQGSAAPRPAVIRELGPGDEPTSVHILYIGPGKLPEARKLLLSVERQPVLVVTDDEGGLARGGTINFVRLGRNLKFEISLKAARLSGLKVSSGLLSVAARVEDEPEASDDS